MDEAAAGVDAGGVQRKAAGGVQRKAVARRRRGKRKRRSVERRAKGVMSLLGNPEMMVKAVVSLEMTLVVVMV